MKKQIPGFEMYSIDYDGNVWSKYSNKILKAQKTNKGYTQVGLYKNRKCHTLQIHRIMAITFLPNFHNKLFVNHINKNRSDNHLWNLRWATDSEQHINLKSISVYKNGYIIQIIRDEKIIVNKYYPIHNYSIEQIIAIRDEFYKAFSS